MGGRPVLSRMGWRIIRLLIALALLGLAGAPPLAAQVYTITDLGTLDGISSEAYGLNGSGHVIGWSTTASGAVHAFLYRDGVMTDLGTLPGGTYSYATGISDLGQVVGYGGINEHGPQFREIPQAFIWDNGSMQSLGALHCPCTFNRRYGTSAAYGVNINASGQVVGSSETVRGSWVHHAFLWNRVGGMEDIGGGAGSLSISAAYGINAAGQVVGEFNGRAFLWQSGVMQDLGTLPGHASSSGRAINASGQAVGESVAAEGSVSRAFLWDSGAMHDLGTLPGDPSAQARDINAAGQVVGKSGTRDGSISRAFLWQRGVMYDLNTLVPASSGWFLGSAAAINDAGQIVGVGVNNGQVRAFLLTPSTPAMPERTQALPR